jgi:hypothetical protein
LLGTANGILSAAEAVTDVVRPLLRCALFGSKQTVLSLLDYNMPVTILPFWKWDYGLHAYLSLTPHGTADR